MKAKVINSKSEYYGRIVNVRKLEDTRFFANRYQMVYGKGVFFGDELDFNITPVNNLVSFDWSAFRREAAKDILCALCSFPPINYKKDVEQAINIADELIKQLQEDKK